MDGCDTVGDLDVAVDQHTTGETLLKTVWIRLTLLERLGSNVSPSNINFPLLLEKMSRRRKIFSISSRSWGRNEQHHGLVDEILTSDHTSMNFAAVIGMSKLR